MTLSLYPAPVVKIGGSLFIHVGRKEAEILKIKEGDQVDISELMKYRKVNKK